MPLDAESTPSVTINVLAQEVGGPLFIQQDLTLNILDVNDAPILNDTIFIISEDAAIGAEVGRLQASDQDENDTFIFSIAFDAAEDEEGFPFSIDPNSGAIAINGSLNFENAQRFVFNVEVTDAGGLSSIRRPRGGWARYAA